MKEAVTKLKTEFNAKLLYWNNLKSSKAKAAHPMRSEPVWM